MFIAATIAVLITMALTLMGFMTGRPDFLDIALVYALINFLGTVAVLKLFEFSDQASGVYQEDDY